MTEQENTKIRHDWYQTESHVILNILCKGVKADDFKINYEPQSVSISLSNEEGVKHYLNFNLLHEVQLSECSYKISSSKVEIKLKKKEGIRWTTLENDGMTDTSVKQEMSKVLDYPSSALKQKDWDKLVGDINKEDDKLEGDAALNALFQKIYSEGSDEVRKAMNKSFVESAGTVLSTNWGEVKKEKVNMKPPDGMEFKKWN